MDGDLDVNGDVDCDVDGDLDVNGDVDCDVDGDGDDVDVDGDVSRQQLHLSLRPALQITNCMHRAVCNVQHLASIATNCPDVQYSDVCNCPDV